MIGAREAAVNGDTTSKATANLDRLFGRSYRRLHQIAAGYFRSERARVTLQPTAVVHQAYVRLAEGWRQVRMTTNRFLGVAARVMRQVLVDEARRRGAEMRGGGRVRVALGEELALGHPRSAELLDLQRLLRTLATWDRRKAEIVRLRCFWGLTVPEVAETLGLSEATVNRDWRMARAWLASRLEAR